MGQSGEVRECEGHSLCVTGTQECKFGREMVQVLCGVFECELEWCVCVYVCVCVCVCVSVCLHHGAGLLLALHVLGYHPMPSQTAVTHRQIRSNLFCPHQKGNDGFKVMEIPPAGADA